MSHDLTLVLIGFCLCGLLEWAIWLSFRMRNLPMKGFSVWASLHQYGLGVRIAELVCTLVGHAPAFAFTTTPGIDVQPAHTYCLRCAARVPARRDT